MARRVRKRTIYQKIVIPILGLLLVEALLFPAVFIEGGFLAQFEQNAFDVLAERSANRKTYLETEMLNRWAAISESESNVLQTIDDTLSSLGATYADIGVDPKLNEKIVEATAAELIYMLRKQGVTDAFIILDGPGVSAKEDSRAGLYLRDLDPLTYSVNNADLMLERGMPNLSKQLGIALDSYWSAAFEFDFETEPEQESYFFAPLRAAQSASVAERADSANFGYWGLGITLDPIDGAELLTYSIPLIASDGTVLGVLGVSVSQRYLTSLMQYKELIESGGMYMFGRLSDSGELIPVFVNGPAFKSYFAEGEAIPLAKTAYEGVYEMTGSRDQNSERFYVSVQRFKLYNVNTPFEAERIVLAGAAQSYQLMAFSRQIKQTFTIITIGSLLAGLVAALFVGRIISGPIRKLVTQLKTSDPNGRIYLEKLHIEEIDELTISIENLSEAVAASASKISKIVAMTGVHFGVFEHRAGEARVYCSDGFAEMIGTDWQEPYVSLETFERGMRRFKSRRYADQENIYCLEKKDGLRYIRLAEIVDGNGRLGTVTDVTGEVEEKRKIEYERDFDVLTDLLNRRAFYARVGLLFARPEDLKHACVIMWDLDNLKYINDTYGHEWGDRYIQAFAKCLKSFDAFHGGIVARRSGDEFYTFLSGYDGEQRIREIIREVWGKIAHSSLEMPDGSQIRLRVSAGVAWYPADSLALDELIRFADFAMYASKRNKKGTILNFSRTMYQEDLPVINGPEKLSALIEQRSVGFALQPIVSARDGGIYGYELLMRPKVEGISSPLDVLKIARAHSKLYQIEELSWFEGMRAFAAQCAAGAIPEDARVFVNSIASESLSDADFCRLREMFGDLVARVVMEITEGEPLEPQRNGHKCDIVRRMGGLIALDDYGSGYSSEALLLSVKPQIVKIDIGFIRGIQNDPGKQMIVGNLIRYAHAQGSTVVAEGVETDEELDRVIGLGVDYLQGYRIARPAETAPRVSAEALRAIARANGRKEG